VSPTTEPRAEPGRSSRLVLIDGHSIIHRSYHAMKIVKEPLKLRSTGELIGAPFGFANTFLHMFGELKPTHVIVTLDSAGPTFRHEITDTYKATRVAMPDEEREEFSRQMKRSRQVIETFGIPIFELPGYEADDLMGALSVQAAKEGIDTYLVSMDSDIAQLVTPDVHLWMYRPYQRDSVIYKGPEDVIERYGVLPEQMPDLKALKGDTSDNIPGIPGVGEKTAIKLVQQFGSVEQMLDNIDAIEQPKLQAAVREAADQIRQSKRLAIIDSAAPVNLDLRAADFYAHYDRTTVSKFFQEMEFRTLLSRLPEPTGKIAVPTDGAAPAETHVSVVNTEDALDKLVGRVAKQKSFVLDTETTTREAMRADLVGLSVALGDGDAYYIPTGHALRLDGNGQLPVDLVLAKLAPLIEDPDIEKTGHYLKYDEVVLGRHGVEPQGIAFDTMIAAHLLGEGGGAGRPEEGSLALGWLGARRLGIELQDRNALLNPTNKRSATITWDQVDINAAGQCSGACADAIGRLRAVLEPELDEKGMRSLFDEVEMPLVSVLARMEQNGVAVDTGSLHEMGESLTMDIRRIEEDIYASVGHEFNIGSPIQLSQILFDELQLPKTRRLKTGAYSTDQQSLEGLRGLHEIIDHIYSYRELTKLKSTYLDTLPYLVHPQTHRIHTEFNQTGAATGRLASSNPNLMNIPVRTELGEQIRRAFIARDVGPEPMLLAADYSQIELRIVAHMTEDPGLIEAFLNDDDIHAATAARVFGVPIGDVTPNMRRRAKVFNFGVLYGLSDYGLSVREKISREEAGEFIRTYFEKYPGMQRYTSETIQRVREYGYVETLFGRRRYIPEIHSTNFNVRNAAERAAVNMPVQGTAADIIKIAMNRLDAEMQRRNMRSLMILQVHDELIFECPGEELEDMRRLCLDIMPKSLEMKVPLKVDTKTGRNWGEMQYGEAVELGELTGA
jgi:DNA polymerase-1